MTHGVLNSNIKMQQLVYFIWALAYIPRNELILAWKSVILVKLKSILDGY